MDINEKIRIIQENKNTFNKLLEESNSYIDSCLKDLSDCIINYNEYVHFTETTLIYNKCKYQELKSLFNSLKKRVKNGTKILKNITKKYSYLTNYYLNNEINILNAEIKKIDDKIGFMLYEYDKLKIIYRDINLRCFKVSKRQSALVIDYLNDDISNILKNIHNNYIEKKNIISELNILRMKKKKISIEIKLNS